MPIPDRHCRERTVLLGPVQLGMRLDLTCWTVGVWADVEPASLGFDLGPLGLTISHDGWNGPLPAWLSSPSPGWSWDGWKCALRAI